MGRFFLSLFFHLTPGNCCRPFRLEVLHCAYGHVGGALTFFEKLAAAKHSRYNKISFFSSHPLYPKRLHELQAYSRQHGFGSGKLTPLSNDF